MPGSTIASTNPAAGTLLSTSTTGSTGSLEGSGTAAAGEVLFYHADGLGSVRAITDGFGVILAREETDEYGVQLSQGSAQPFGYAGEVRDAETGFVYLRARTYDPATGRFLSRDPFPGFTSSPMSQNPYAYAGNNPVNLTDPSGHVVIIPGNEAGTEDSAGIGGWWSPSETDILMLLSVGPQGVLAVGAAFVIKTTGKLVGHHSIPVQALKYLERYAPDIAKAVRGKPGDPNIWPTPETLHKAIHTGPAGGRYNAEWLARLDALRRTGGFTESAVRTIREDLAERYLLSRFY